MAIMPIPIQLVNPIIYFNINKSKIILNTIWVSPIKAIYVTLPSIIALFINIDPKQPRNPLNKRMIASLKERNLISSKGEYNWNITAPETANNEKYCKITNEWTWLFNDFIITYATAVSNAVTSARQRPTKYKIEYSEFSFPKSIGGFVIKITPIIQVIISIVVLILILSFLYT